MTETELNVTDAFLTNALVEYYCLSENQNDLIFFNEDIIAIARLLLTYYVDKNPGKILYSYKGLDSAKRFKDQFEVFLAKKILKEKFSIIKESESPHPLQHTTTNTEIVKLVNTKVNQYLTQTRPEFTSLQKLKGDLKKEFEILASPLLIDEAMNVIQQFELLPENAELVESIRDLKFKLQRNEYTEAELKYSEQALNETIMTLETKAKPEVGELSKDEIDKLNFKAMVLETRLDVYDEEAPLVKLQIANRRNKLKELEAKLSIRFFNKISDMSNSSKPLNSDINPSFFVSDEVKKLIYLCVKIEPQNHQSLTMLNDFLQIKKEE